MAVLIKSRKFAWKMPDVEIGFNWVTRWTLMLSGDWGGRCWNLFQSCKIIVQISHVQLIMTEVPLHKKMKFFMKNFFSKCDQIRRLRGIWSHLLKKSLMENFIFCAVSLSLKAVIRFAEQIIRVVSIWWDLCHEKIKIH